jgi:hypothetical protein
MTGFDPFSAHAQMKAAKRAALREALTGRSIPGNDEHEGPPRSTGFDGGARMNQPAPPERHGETLTRLFATGEADIRRRLHQRCGT